MTPIRDTNSKTKNRDYSQHITKYMPSMKAGLHCQILKKDNKGTGNKHQVKAPNQQSDPSRMRVDRSKFLVFIARYQTGRPNPSPKEIVSAEKVFAHLVSWGAFVEVKQHLYQSLPLGELIRIFEVFQRFSALEGIVGEFDDEFDRLQEKEYEIPGSSPDESQC
jgi:hypothetical protein